MWQLQSLFELEVGESVLELEVGDSELSHVIFVLVLGFWLERDS
jgi:hypothetical protein